MKVGLNNIKKAYSLLKQQAFEMYECGEYGGCFHKIKQSTILPIQFNWIYSDDDIEGVMQKMSSKVIRTKNDAYIGDDKKVVLIDDFCRSFILALQYIEAFTQAGYEVLYITYKECVVADDRSIIPKLQSYEKVSVSVVDVKSYIERAQYIYNSITDFKACKVFLHTTECSDSLLALYPLPSQIKRYMINLSDQRFWIGTKAIDYSLEFRPFGATVSYERRGLKKEQLLYVPFYPIDDKHDFKGFPEKANGRVVIFTGGDFYKTIDPNYVYWRLIRDILNQNPQAIVLFAIKHNIGTKANEFVSKFIRKNKFEDRFISIGFRNDICEVFKHCDIYLGTCPTSGSLMSQLAALYSKPILQFYLPDTSDDETEQALCYNDKLFISFENEADFLCEAKNLIESEEYRRAKGEALHKSMLSTQQFNERLLDKIHTHDYSDCERKFVNHEQITERWLFAEKMGYMNTYSFIKSLFGNRMMLKVFPVLWLQDMCSKIVMRFK